MYWMVQYNKLLHLNVYICLLKHWLIVSNKIYSPNYLSEINVIIISEYPNFI